MPSESRLSPRAAIQTWLARTEDQAGTTTTILRRSHNSGNTIDESSRACPKLERNVAEPALTKTAADLGREIAVDQSRKAAIPEGNSIDRKYNADDIGLAERLGLHAPFRTFACHKENERLENHGSHRKRKRDRDLSSSSSLKPAETVIDLTTNHRRRDLDEGRVKHHKHECHRSDRGFELPSSARGASSPEKPAKRYEKRPRRKTKEDKYDVKQDGKHPTKARRKKDKKDGKATKQDKKRKRKERSGDALMHTFSAPNVAQERLTIRPAAPLGLFGKGRASSPVRRRGREFPELFSQPPLISLPVPDLTFSEVAFLNPRRSKPETSAQQAPKETKRRRKDKTVNAEEQMSRFFTAKRPDQRKGVDRAEQRKDMLYRANPVATELSDINEPSTESPLPPVELPERPFLGFGSSGATLTSPVKLEIDRDALCRRSSRSEPRLSRKSSLDSSSYYTWSTSASSSWDRPEHKGVDFEFPEVCPNSHGTPSTAQTHRPFNTNDTSAGGIIDVIVDNGITRTLRDPSKEKSTLKATLPDDPRLAVESQAEVSSKEMPNAQSKSAAWENISDGKVRIRAPISNIETNIQATAKETAKDQEHSEGSKPQLRIGNAFPQSFDTALESLLEACKVPPNLSEKPTGASRETKGSEKLHLQTGREYSTTGRRITGETDGRDKPTSDSMRFYRGASDRDPTTTSWTENGNSDRAPNLPHTGQNIMPTNLASRSNGFELPAKSNTNPGSRYESDDQTPSLSHQRLLEPYHPSAGVFRGAHSRNAWHSYQSIYENQMLPGGRPCGDGLHMLEDGFDDRLDAGSHFLHRSHYTEGEPESLNEVADDGTSYIEGGAEANYDDGHPLELSAYLYYNEYRQLQQLEDSEMDFPGLEPLGQVSGHSYGYPASTIHEGLHSPDAFLGMPEPWGASRDAIAPDEASDSAPMYYSPPTQNEYGESILDQDQYAEDDPNEDYLASFWRPNRLY